jgi:lysozyme
LLIRHEGLRLKPYRDTVGKLTLGVGRNLDDLGITHDEALFLLQNDLERCRCELNNAFPWWVKLGEVREAVLLSLCFNLGITKLLSFKTTVGLIEAGKYAEAADRLLTLPWASQVGKNPPCDGFPHGQRAYELTQMLRTDKWSA